MRFEAETLDDALLKLYPELISRGANISASRGRNAEILGVLIEIEQARARLSRSETRGRLFSSLVELLWYLTGDNQLEFIEPYISRYREDSEDGRTVYGGYAKRIILSRLGSRSISSSRRLCGISTRSENALASFSILFLTPSSQSIKVKSSPCRSRCPIS
jgi:hypothetical protein